MRFHFAGETLIADPSGAAIWPAARTAFFADLHFEKATAAAMRHGRLLPPYDTRRTLSDMAAVFARHPVDTVICLGDSFHDGGAAARLAAADHDTLARMIAPRDWIWILGNHDPHPPAGLAGRVADDHRHGPFTLRHIAAPAPVSGEISGHFHPKASLRLRGRRISGPCFVLGDTRLILPAFGAYTGGLDIGDPAIDRLFDGRFSILLRAAGGVHPIGRAHLPRRRPRADD